MWSSDRNRNETSFLGLVASDAAYKVGGFGPNTLLRTNPDNSSGEDYPFKPDILNRLDNIDASSPLAYEPKKFQSVNGESLDGVEFQNWRQFASIEDEDTGFGAVIYRRGYEEGSVLKAEYIVAFRGTDGRNGQDWYANIQLAKGQWVEVNDQIAQALSQATSPDGSIPRVHFTGQSLGGALAQYAAYEYVRQRETSGTVLFDARFEGDRANLVTLTTFNAFAAGLGLRQLYDGNDGRENFSPVRMAGVATAHYSIENDVVHNLGGSFTGDDLEYGFLNAKDGNTNNLYHFGTWRHWDAAVPGGTGTERTDPQGFLGLVEGHRTETGFYQGLDRYETTFTSAIRGGDPTGLVKVDQLQAVGEIFARFLGGNRSGEFASWARLTAGVAMGSLFGSVGDVARLLRLVANSLYKSDDINEVTNTLIGSKIGSYFTAIGVKLLGKLTLAIGGASSLVAAIADLFGKAGETAEARKLVNLNTSSSDQFHAVNVKSVNDGSPIGAADSVRRLSTLMTYLAPEAAKNTKLEGFESALDAVADDAERFTSTLYGASNGYKNALVMLTNDARVRAFANDDEETTAFGSALTRFALDEANRIGGDNAEVVTALYGQVGDFVVDLTKSVAAASGISSPQDSPIVLSQVQSYSDFRAMADRLMAELEDLNFATLFGISEESAPELAAKIGDAKYYFESTRIALAIQNVAAGANAFESMEFDPRSIASGFGLAEGQAITLKADLSYPAPKDGMRVRFQIAGASVDSIAVVNGADTVQLDGSGVFEMHVPEGQRQMTFVLWQNKGISANSALTLSATLVDRDGVAIHETSTEATFALVATDEGTDTPTTTYTILGDQASGPGSSTDPYGNIINGQPAPDRNDFLNGSPANDLIEGLGGDDTINGHDGDDWILGGDGNDWMAGLAGDDRIEGGEGNDFAIGGAGRDLMLGGAGGDSLLGTEGDDRIYANAQADDETVFDSDTVTATLEEHWLDGGEGRDRLIGGTGADVMLGGAGEDMLAGGAGADTLYGDRDTRIDPFPIPPGSTVTLTTDEINAAGGADFLHGGGGDDTLYGEVGADTLLGAGGNDTLIGDANELAEALHGGDFLDGGDGDDRLFGQGGNDALYGGAGNDVLQGDDLTHAPGDDYLSGEDGDDQLIGVGGRDVLYGGAGNDQLFGDSDDTPFAQQMADELFGGEGEDFLQGYGGDDYVDGGAGADTVLGGLGQDRILGGAGNDVLVGDEGDGNPDGGDADIVDGGEGDDTLFGQGGDDQLFGGSGVDQLQGGIGNDYLDGGAGNDTLVGEAGNDVLQGGEGEDTLAGGDGEDTLRGGAGNDLIAGDNGGTDSSGAADIIEGGAGNDQIIGQGGDDRIDGGDGDDVVLGNLGNDVIAGGAGADELQGNEGDDQIDGGDGDDFLFGGIGSDVLNGGFGDDFLQGDAGSDTLAGGGGHDLYAYGLGDGIDTIVDAGGNTLQLGFSYFPGAVSLRVGSLVLDFGGGSEIHIEGFDPGDPFGTSSITEFQFAGGTTLTLDELLALGFDLDGTPEADVLEGTALDDRIDAYESDDIVFGKAGNDTIDAGSGDDVVDAGAGHDVVQGAEGADLLMGGAGADSLEGGEGDDSLSGDEGDDRLDGGVGADQLAGGTGDDTYVISDEMDTIVEGVDEGYDAIESAITYTLPENVEELALTGTDDISGTGNEFDNDLEGNSGNNELFGLGGDDSMSSWEGDDFLDGGEGADFMFGYVGDDIYVVDNEGDIVDEQLDFYDYEIVEDPDTGEISYATLEASGGNDTVLASVSFELDPWTENLTLTGADAIDGVGNVESNVIVGNEADNALYAYRVNGVADTYPSIGVFVQQFGLARNSAEEMLADKANVEIYRGRFPWFVPQQVDLFAGAGDTLIGGGGDDRLYGHLDDDWIEGGEGDDLLYGFTGADTMIGGAGDDTYVVSGAYDLIFSYQGGEYVSYFDESQDELIELEDEGIDTVYSEVSFELPENFENLTLVFTTTAFDPDGQISVRFGREFAEEGIGNDLANILRTEVSASLEGEDGDDLLIGSEFSDYLDGGEGTDVLRGGRGDDYYYIEDDVDLVVEEGVSGAEQGIDTVESEISYTLGANVENLFLTGDEGDEDLGGTGNELDNLIEGNAGDNVLVGLDGNDELNGFEGEDTLLGGAGSDALDGGWDADFMSGGDGDDTYWVADEFDVTIEDSAAGGHDLVFSSVSHTLGDNVEDLQLQEFDPEGFFVGSINGFGNELDNRITGNGSENALEGLGGSDTLLGGGGADTLLGGDGDDWLDGGDDDDYFEGGAGNDTYLVDGDDYELYELANEGIDLAISTSSLSLAENVENLVLVGDFAVDGFDVDELDGVGNALDNVILGNDAENDLEGLDGHDDIDGRAGDDDLEGGEGDDTLYGGDDAITIALDDDDEDGDDGDGDDDDEFDGLSKRPHGGGRSFLASNDDEIDGGEGDDSIDGGSGDDWLFGGDGDDFIYGGDDGLVADDVVDDGGGEEFFALSSFGETENGLRFLTNDDELEGGDGDDVLDGGSGNDELYGGVGADTLYGGADGPLNTGNDDRLDGGEGIDFMAGGTGDDEYRVDGTFYETTDIPVYSDCGTLVEGAVTRVWTTDTVVEHAGEGYDRIVSTAEITLPDHVEELQLANFAFLRIGRGNSGDNAIYGNSSGNRLEGGAGNDQLFGRFGNDVLDGGAGDDELHGEAGDDIYNLGPGSGHDTVFNFGGGADSVHVTMQIAASEVTFSTNGDDVTLGIDGSRDRMVLHEWFSSSTPVQQVVFCDGTVFDGATIAALAGQLELVAANDVAQALEDGPAVTGNVLTNDFDSDPAAVLTVYGPGTWEGLYGTLTIAGNGDFSFVAGEGAQWLAEGEAATEGFAYRAQDARNANDEGVVEIAVIGTNDAPLFEAGGAGAITEDAPERELGGELLENGDLEDFFFEDWEIEGDLEFVGHIESTLDDEAGYFGAIGEATLLGQEIETWGEQSYLVSFWLRGGGMGGATFSAGWNGAELVSLSDVVLEDYTEFSFVVAGAEDFSRLEFALRNDPDFWYLDEISVRPLDEFVPDEASVSGSLLFTDVDLSDTHQVVSIEGQGEDYVGFFDAYLEWDSTFSDNGSVGWFFEVEHEDIDFLAEGQVLRQYYDVTIEDAFGAIDSETVVVTLHGSNDAPDAEEDEAFVTEDLAPVASGNVLENDEDPDDGAVLTVTKAGTFLGEFGTLVLAADGNYTYTLDNNAAQSMREGDEFVDYFDYEISDGLLNDDDTLYVYIGGTNDAPVAADDLAGVHEDVVLAVNGNVLENDSDIDEEDDLAVIDAPAVYAGHYGTLALEEDGSFSYTLDNASAAVQALAAGQTVIDSFAYGANDSYEITPGLLAIAVSGTNDAPLALDDAAAVIEDLASGAAGNLLANDGDIDNGAVLAVATPGMLTGAYGTLTVAENGDYAYVLSGGGEVQALRQGETAFDVFTYAASDGILLAAAELVVSIYGINDAPVTGVDAGFVQEDGMLQASGNVLANDADADAGAVLSVLAGTFEGLYGTLTLVEDGSYSYDLDNGDPGVQSLAAGQTVADVFSYTVSDGIESALGVLAINIAGANDAPNVMDDAASVQEDLIPVASGNVLANDDDIDQQTVLSVANAGLYGSLSLEEDGDFVYALDNASAAVQALAAGQTVFETFDYLASDGIESVPGTLTIAISGTNDAPLVANLIADQSAEAGSAFSFTFAADTFADVDQGDVLAYTASLVNGQPLPDWLSFDPATRTFTGTPPGGVGCDGTEAEELQIRVQATDLAGAGAFDDFALGIAGGGGGGGGQTIIGTDGNDVLAGTPCDDIIDGRKGYDVMAGGAGDDVYFVDKTCEPGHGAHHHHKDKGHADKDCKVDKVVEAAGGGYDIVYASADYALAANVEALWLLGDKDLDGTGNSLDNVLAGNGGDNRLKGGLGSDLYLYELHGGKDVIEEKGGQDVLRFGEGITQQMVRVKRDHDDLVLDLPGSHDSVTIKGWFDSSSKRVERIEFADGGAWNEAAIRERVQGHGSGDWCDPWRGDDRDNGRDHHRKHDERDDRRDDKHDHGPRRDDDWHGGRLGKPAHFDFDDFHRNARGWSRVQAYAHRLAAEDADDPKHGAPTRGGKAWSLLGAALGGGTGWGYDGSVGAARGPEDLKSLEGLMEGFRRL
jgi:VCBS repeat-containing protein